MCIHIKKCQIAHTVCIQKKNKGQLELNETIAFSLKNND